MHDRIRSSQIVTVYRPQSMSMSKLTINFTNLPLEQYKSEEKNCRDHDVDEDYNGIDCAVSSSLRNERKVGAKIVYASH